MQSQQFQSEPVNMFTANMGYPQVPFYPHNQSNQSLNIQSLQRQNEQIIEEQKQLQQQKKLLEDRAQTQKDIDDLKKDFKN